MPAPQTTQEFIDQYRKLVQVALKAKSDEYKSPEMQALNNFLKTYFPIFEQDIYNNFTAMSYLYTDLKQRILNEIVFIAPKTTSANAFPKTLVVNGKTYTRLSDNPLNLYQVVLNNVNSI